MLQIEDIYIDFAVIDVISNVMQLVWFIRAAIFGFYKSRPLNPIGVLSFTRDTDL